MLAAIKGAAAILVFSAVSVLLITQSVSTQSPLQKTSQEQTDFGSDSELDRPVPVPPAALGALRSALKATPDELPGDELKASEIHLAGPTETDLIVPRVAAHAAFFYILRPTASGYELIFDSGGDSMTVLPTKSKGYRDLRTWNYAQAGTRETATVYRFNGRRYVGFSKKANHAKE